MSDWRLLSNLNGKTTKIQRQADGSYLIRAEQECDPYLNRNKILRDDDPYNGYDARREYQRIASIPPVIQHQWLQEGIDIYSGECQDRVARKLNDPDNFFLRTGGGRLGPVGNGTYR